MPSSATARSSVASEAACDTAQFSSLSGAGLVTAVKGATSDCINKLFSLKGSTAYYTFREAQMVTIANALRSAASSYDGTNAGNILQLILFMRAGYYVQYYDPATIGAYGTALRDAVRPALDAFAANPKFSLVNDAHGEVLAEFVTLLDSSGENARYLPVIKRLLNSYTTAFSSSYWMKVAVNNCYIVVFRGHYLDNFRTLVQSDSSIVDTLYDFANRQFGLFGTDDDYLAANAGRELARFLQYSGALKTKVQGRVKALADRTTITGTTAPLWVGLGEMVDEFDKSNCSYYNLCDYKNRLSAAVLPVSYTCSATLRIRAQSMNTSELASACTTVGGQETYFHNQLATGRVAVANDNNSALEMVVFDSSRDYRTYAGALYGIDTNNGGMYLEGDPSSTTNQARFIAYEAEWARPAFEIWNLTHEYVHYLDGRFNMYGDFTDGTENKKTVWWIEGMAEYMSYSYRNLTYTGAVEEAAAGTYPLSTVFQNDYSSGQTRVYRWGYLASRFLFEKHRADVTSIVGYFRPGNYAGYTSFMSGIGSRYDAEFRTWLTCVATPTAPGCTTGNQPPVAGFGFTSSGLTVNFTDSSSDPDGSIASRRWEFGDGSTSTATHPSKAYAAPGTYSVKLTVTDNRGATASTTKTVTVTSGGMSTVLQNGVPAGNLSGAQGSERIFTIQVPAGASNLRFETSGGTGDVDLYTRLGSAPTSTTFDCSSRGNANAEVCTVAAPQAGTYYVRLLGYSAYTGASLVASYSVSSLPECTLQRPDELGRNCKRSNIAATLGNYAYFFVNVPAGTAQLRITTSGGSGDADLYYSASSWATTASYTQRSITTTNTESITVNNPPAGYLYISLHAHQAFSGVQVSTSF
ncbi:collagenase [Tahibacter amnicola]|uniref:microbial collagenase n=1 Tax=Tahibacter amnicola TaxID=2976241 RepID=A0ABY6BDN0_9GAMM|nr:collagenase [Tahibacter amnicola]UXI67220.1 collagenase [Tahibacter amnicola]